MQKIRIKKTPPTFKNKEDYIGDTNENTHGYDGSPGETDGCARNMGKEHKNEEDSEYSEPTPDINDGIK